MLGPGRRARFRLAWRGLGLALRRLMLPYQEGERMLNGPVDVVAMCAIIRDADRGEVERFNAAFDLIGLCELRSLRDLLDCVTAETGAPVSAGVFDACADAWRTHETTASL